MTFKESLSLRTPANLLRIIHHDKFVHTSDLLHGNEVDAFAREAGGMFAEVFSEVRFHFSGFAIPSLRKLSFGAIRSRHLSSLGKLRLIVIANFFATKKKKEKKKQDICKRTLAILQPTQAECLLNSWLYNPSYILLCYIDIMPSWNNIEPV